jgi:hypothetical protein
MSTSTEISRSAAKAKVREIRASASQISNLLDTAARNPYWASQHRRYIEDQLTEALNETDGTSAQLREGLGLDETR